MNDLHFKGHRLRTWSRRLGTGIAAGLLIWLGGHSPQSLSTRTEAISRPIRVAPASINVLSGSSAVRPTPSPSAKYSAKDLESGSPHLLSRPQDLPPWAVKYGHEFWRSPEPPSQTPTQQPRRERETPSSPRIHEAIERVSHAFAASPDGLGAEVKSGAYQARLQNNGLRFKVQAPNRDGDGMMEITLRTTEIKAGQSVFYDSNAGVEDAWFVLGNTAQLLRNADCSLIEHYETRAQGVELTWIMGQSPHGPDPLTITTEIAGGTDSRLHRGSIHLLDANGIPRLKVGPVLAVDATGRQWTLPVNLQEGVMVVEVTTDILTRAQYPLAIDPWISPEYGLDQPVVSATPSTQAAPAVAANNNEVTLVVWTHGKGDLTTAGIFGARVTDQGALLDPYGLTISSGTHEQMTSAVAANANEFLVVWSAPKSGTTADWDVFAARVDSEGTVQMVPPLCTVGSLQCAPVVAGNGTNFFVAWRDARNTGIFGLLLRADGSRSVTNGVSLTGAASDQLFPAIASAGGGFLVVWQDYRKANSSQFYADIYGTRISAEGTVLDPLGLPICTRTNTQWFPAVAANDHYYLVGWEEYNSQGNDIWATRVTFEGVVLDTNGLAICTAPNSQTKPALASTSEQFLAAWQDYRNAAIQAFHSDIYATRLDAQAQVLDPDGLAITTAPNTQGLPRVTANATGFHVVWQDFRRCPTNRLSDIFGAHLDPLGQLSASGEQQLSTSPNFQMSPAVAANSSQYLVVWADNRDLLGSGWDIYGIRLDAAGQVLDFTGLPICCATNHQKSPAVAANGTDYWVSWADWRNSSGNSTNADIYGVRVLGDGRVVNPDGLPLCTAAYDQNYPAVSALGDRYLVVWQDARSSLTNLVRWDIYGTRIAGGGRVLDPAGIPISTVLNNQTLPSVAAGTRLWLVAWEDRRVSSNPDIYGARLDLEGTVLDKNGLPLGAALQSQTTPSVTANGSEFLVTWTDARNTASSLDIYGARITETGVLLDPTGLALRRMPNQQSSPSAIVQGGDFFITWQEAGTGVSNNFNLAGEVLTGDGKLVTGSLVWVNTNANDQVNPKASVIQGRFLVVSQGTQYGGSRIIANRVDLDPRFLKLERLADGTFHGLISGPSGQRCDLEFSTDLTHWTRVGTVTNMTGMVEFLDTQAPLHDQGFYRAVVLP